MQSTTRGSISVKTPTPLEMMGMMGRLEQAKRNGTVIAKRPADTYRAARRQLAKAMYRANKKGTP